MRAPAWNPLASFAMALLLAWAAACGDGGTECRPVAETCNGLDDDCDGEIDDGFALNVECTVGQGACAARGSTVCAPGGAATRCDAVPAEPAGETCNGVDDDCDALVDEELPGCCDPDSEVACGADRGVCESGTQTCGSDRAWGACESSAGLPVVLPEQYAETCNGLDDDCDGDTDEGFGTGAPCAAGIGSCRVVGTVVCAGPDGSACGAVAGDPAPEVCDGIDNDCDEDVDEELPDCCAVGAVRACGVTKGACEAGSQTCGAQRAWGPCVNEGGGVVVLPEQYAETCNGLDDDCDGSTDESFPTLGQACDGGDLDQCTNGMWICRADGSGVECAQEEPADVQERCDDALDNDCDGAADCDDPDCAATCEEDSEAHCSDRLDNDRDGLIDCFEPACRGFPFCVENTAELCHDGANNDGDAVTDCADPDCASVCGEATLDECHDGRDNDQDGMPDCRDAGCASVCRETTFEECHDGRDNDQDGSPDCADAGCAAVCPQASGGEYCQQYSHSESDRDVDELPPNRDDSRPATRRPPEAPTRGLRATDAPRSRGRGPRRHWRSDRWARADKGG